MAGVRKKFDELRMTGALPSPSGIGLRILEITKNENYDLDELVRTIMADPALSGRIIRLANSALMGSDEAVQSVPQAAMRLGVKTVRSIALSFTLIADNKRGTASEFDFDSFWTYALCIAVATSQISLEQSLDDPVDAFTCGLLADFGRMALACVHPERYSQLMRDYPDASGGDLARIEGCIFEINHHEVVCLMMEDWGLPLSYRLAVSDSVQEDVSEEARSRASVLRKLIAGGRAIAKVHCTDREADPSSWLRAYFQLETVAASLEIPTTDLLQIGDSAGPAWEEWGRTVGVHTPKPPSLTRIAAELAAAEVRRPDAPAPVDLPTHNLLEDDDLEDLADPPRPDEPIPESWAPTRLLLIDDDERMLRLISHHLRKEGYEVHTATDPYEGMDKALKIDPQILITDWMMPSMTGIELISTLRRSEAGRKMYILIVTAREDDDRVVEAFTAGADDYVVKPFNPRILLARVRAGTRVIRMRERVEDSERAQLRQVAELGILTRRLRSAALTDALTELPNRRYVMRRLKQDWGNFQRSETPLSVILADVDHFKRINDKYGHDVGDAVLRRVGAVLAEGARSGDILARVGGEEFLAINVNADLQSATACAERLRVLVEEIDLSSFGLNSPLTMSFGVAQAALEMDSSDDLIKAADEALYAAKAAGRNRVQCAPKFGDGRSSSKSA
jgi:two-component system, cell cycle response regulator